jgi:hypothetical protein
MRFRGRGCGWGFHEPSLTLQLMADRNILDPVFDGTFWFVPFHN